MGHIPIYVNVASIKIKKVLFQKHFVWTEIYIIFLVHVILRYFASSEFRSRTWSTPFIHAFSIQHTDMIPSLCYLYHPSSSFHIIQTLHQEDRFDHFCFVPFLLSLGEENTNFV